MTESICKDCKNLIVREYIIKGMQNCINEESACTLSDRRLSDCISKCSHFNPKPKKGKDFKPQRVDGLEDLKQNVSACCKAKIYWNVKEDWLWHCKKCGKPCQLTKIDWKPRKYKK